jgi:ketosteroid isomerase-like protein
MAIKSVLKISQTSGKLEHEVKRNSKLRNGDDATNTSQKQIVESVFAALATGDMADAASHFDSNIRIQEAEKSLPYGGEYVGHQGFFSLFQKLANTFENLSIPPTTVVQAGPVVVALTTLNGISKATDVRISMPLTMTVSFPVKNHVTAPRGTGASHSDLRKEAVNEGRLALWRKPFRIEERLHNQPVGKGTDHHREIVGRCFGIKLATSLGVDHFGSQPLTPFFVSDRLACTQLGISDGRIPKTHPRFAHGDLFRGKWQHVENCVS